MTFDQSSDTAVERPSPRLAAREGWVEGLMRATEGIGFFRQIASLLTGLFSKFVRSGSLKDLLSGTWLGHPLHPMLTDVTIGAWTSAVALDLFPSETTDEAATALIGVGVLSALPTAVTGLSDLTDVESNPERAVGGAHALGNISALVLFASSYIARKLGRKRAGITLSLAGAGAATAAGFLGGDLAYRRGIGVDRTTFDDTILDWAETIADSDLKEDPIRVRVGRTDVMLFREGDQIFALANRCSHRGGPLHKGTVGDGRATCPWHLSTFRLEDGAILCGPATAPQKSYEVRVREGTIEIRSKAAG
jgi:nitrite reductase/ring-hydroxylating ferredoxin subunit/uncharacterized membrane protein